MADQIDAFLEAIGEKGNKYIEEKVKNSSKTIYEGDNLVSVDLSDIGIISLYPEMLQPLAGIEELDLSDNMLEFIPEGLFAHLTGLKRLSLKANPIYAYHPKAFEGAKELEDLNLSETQIFYLNSKIFEQMPNLKSVNLSKTKLPHQIRKKHSDISHLRSIVKNAEFMEKAPSKLYFWKNLTFSYLAIICFLAIPITTLLSGNSFNLVSVILFLSGMICLSLDFGIVKRHLGTNPKNV